MKNDISSELLMNKLFFDKLKFTREGFKNDASVFELSLKCEIKKSTVDESYKIELSLFGKKANEYTLEILLVGLFTFRTDGQLDDNTKKTIIEKNTVAIMMPYMRSQVSLLTAQPEMDCVVLPAFNINQMIDSQK